ncbi:MAG: SBBP repeat-containing protein [Zetaproteobacteria bacterium]|nr:SBBP repeat-containing protein [Zetaproteobacteria bacterium]
MKKSLVIRSIIVCIVFCGLVVGIIACSTVPKPLIYCKKDEDCKSQRRMCIDGICVGEAKSLDGSAGSDKDVAELPPTDKFVAKCEDGQKQGCTIEALKGPCAAGQQVCEKGRWGQCKQTVMAEKESCDGADNDCDGKIDNLKGTDKPLSQSCWDGDHQKRGVGECKDGTQTCTNGSWGKCEGQVKPKDENTCPADPKDRKDLNCNGTVGDGCPCTPKATRACGPPKVGICKRGEQTCGDSGKWGECNGATLPATESCNGKDDDCDGRTDNKPGSQDSLTKSCYSGKPASTQGVGECKGGQQTCTNGSWGGCKGEITPADKDDCNDKDDDCDGKVDEDFKSQDCYRAGALEQGGVGACKKGKTACENGKNVCNGDVAPTKETCNGLDDDCDGEIDEGLTGCKKEPKPEPAKEPVADRSKEPVVDRSKEPVADLLKEPVTDRLGEPLVDQTNDGGPDALSPPDAMVRDTMVNDKTPDAGTDKGKPDVGTPDTGMCLQCSWAKLTRGNQIPVSSSYHAVNSKGTYEAISFVRSHLLIVARDQRGAQLWKPLNVSGDIIPRGVAVDAQGNIYVAGTFRGKVVFGSTTLQSLPVTKPTYDAFIVKVSSVGKWLWAERFGSTGFDLFTGIKVDLKGSIYVSGSFQGTVSIGGISASVKNFGDDEIVIAKFDAKRNPKLIASWVTTAGNTGADQAQALALDTAGNVYITGQFSGTVVFGTTTLTAGSTKPVFVAKLDSKGKFQWADNVGTAAQQRGIAIAVNSSHVFMVTDDQGGFGNVGVFRYTLQGKVGWKLTVGSTRGRVNSLALDPAGNVYIVGRFVGKWIFPIGTISSNGASDDWYVIKLDKVSGQPRAAFSAGSAGNDEAFSVTWFNGMVHVSGGMDNPTSTYGTGGLSTSGSGAAIWRFKAP